MTILVIDTIATLIFTALLPPFFGIVVLVVALAGLGKTLGLRLKYVEILLYIFEFGKKRLAKHRKYLSSTSEPSDDDEEEVVSSENQSDIIIRKNSTIQSPPLEKVERHDFNLSDVCEYITNGMEAIVDDEVTKRFSAEELTSWNFLTRTNRDYEFISVRLTVFWVVGFVVRYFFLLPLRVCILCIGVGLLVGFTTVITFLPDGPFRMWLGNHTYLTAFRIVGRAISSVIYFHNLKNRPKPDGICVANHTSPIDCVILSCDNVYAFVGQRHGGLLGIFQRALSRASDHIWFERSEAKDRYAVAKRLKNHVEDPKKMPILIFPEGTCINNTSVMQFKKGTFEVGGIIYPVAIKYDARFGDAFWNSSKYSMISYIYMMMTSWAIVCDVWYLPPMKKKESETSIEFANRVKAEIAKQGGLVDLLWDGALKRSAPKKELKEQFQQEFSRRLKLHDISETEQIHNELYANSEEVHKTITSLPEYQFQSTIGETRRRRRGKIDNVKRHKAEKYDNVEPVFNVGKGEEVNNTQINRNHIANHDGYRYDEVVSNGNGDHESSHILSCNTEYLREINSRSSDSQNGLENETSSPGVKIRNSVNSTVENHFQEANSTDNDSNSELLREGNSNSINDYNNSELLEKGRNIENTSLYLDDNLQSKLCNNIQLDKEAICLQNHDSLNHNGTVNDVEINRTKTE